MSHHNLEQLIVDTAYLYGNPDVYWEHSTALQFLNAYEECAGDVTDLRGKFMLDLGCGSVRSNDEITDRDHNFEPWLPRIISRLGATAIGVDTGDLSEETFPWLQRDLRTVLDGSLPFKDQSFDIVHIAKLLDSPTLTTIAQVNDPPAAAVRELNTLAGRLMAESQRVLKDNGWFFAASAQFQRIGVPMRPGIRSGQYMVYRKQHGLLVPYCN